MIGEAWDYITDGISQGWEAITSIFSSGLFDEVNFTGWLILSIIAEIVLWGFWYYTTFVMGSKNPAVQSFFNIKIMIVSTFVAPAIAYFFALRESRK